MELGQNCTLRIVFFMRKKFKEISQKGLLLKPKNFEKIQKKIRKISTTCVCVSSTYVTPISPSDRSIGGVIKTGPRPSPRRLLISSANSPRLHCQQPINAQKYLTPIFAAIFWRNFWNFFATIF